MGEQDAAKQYQVIYKSGLPEGPKSKLAPLKLILGNDGFQLEPTQAATRFWTPLAIPYASIFAVTIVARRLGMIEGLLSVVDGEQSELANNIQIEYLGTAETVVQLRVEMLTGITPAGQARRCKEFVELLQTRGISAKFRAAFRASESNGDIPAQIAELSALHDRGILTEEEFTDKKTELLGRL